jgi:hypothetical protein
VVQHRLLSAEKKGALLAIGTIMAWCADVCDERSGHHAEMSVEWNQTGRVGKAMAGDTFGLVSPAMWEDTPVAARASPFHNRDVNVNMKVKAA